MLFLLNACSQTASQPNRSDTASREEQRADTADTADTGNGADPELMDATLSWQEIKNVGFILYFDAGWSDADDDLAGGTCLVTRTQVDGPAGTTENRLQIVRLGGESDDDAAYIDDDSLFFGFAGLDTTFPYTVDVTVIDDADHASLPVSANVPAR